MNVRLDHQASTTPPPVVFVVDNDDGAREMLEPLLRTAGWQTESFACAQEFLARPREPVASCLVLEVELPDIGGLELQQILGSGAEMPVVFVTACGDIPTTVRAMKAGAVDFLTKPFDGTALTAAVANAIERSKAALHEQACKRELRDRYETLSPRQREVMALVVCGLLNKQVGAELGISEITVKTHRGQVMGKMEAGSLPDLVTMAARLGLRPPPRAEKRPVRSDIGIARYLRAMPAPALC